jgi:hypothetical protein
VDPVIVDIFFRVSLSRPAIDLPCFWSFCELTLYIEPHVFFCTGQTNIKDGSSKARVCDGSKGGGKNAQTITFGYVFLGCMIAELRRN